MFLASGRNVVVSGCVIANSTNWGIQTDRTLSLLLGPYTFEIAPALQTQHESLVITGCNIHDNGGNGVEVRGIRGTSRIGESFIGNNGQGGLKATSGFSEVLIDYEVGNPTTGSGQQLVIENNIFGNQKTTTITNGAQYGVRSTDVGGNAAIGDLLIQGNYFQDLNDPVSLAGGNTVHVVLNTFIVCANNITVPSTSAWLDNRVRGGTLEGSEWDHEAIRILGESKSWAAQGSVASGDSVEETVTVTGAAIGDPCVVGFSGITVSKFPVYGQVTAADTVIVTATNLHESGAQTHGAGTIRVRVYKH
jgi:hypothetical protein